MAFAIGLINAFGSLGNFLGTLVCAAVAPRWGNVGVYTAAAMFAACALFMSVFWVKETKPQEKGKTSKSPSMSELFSIAKIPDVVFFAVLAAVALFVFYATGPSFTPLVAEDFFAVNKVQLSILSSISLLASAASSMLCGAIPVRFNSKHILIGAFAVVALVNTLTPFAPGYVTLCILQATNSFVSHVPFRLFTSPGRENGRHQIANRRHRFLPNDLCAWHHLRADRRRHGAKHNRQLPLDLCDPIFAASCGHACHHRPRPAAKNIQSLGMILHAFGSLVKKICAIQTDTVNLTAPLSSYGVPFHSLFISQIPF